MKNETYVITGMHCAACSAAVQRVISRLDGVENCEVNLITEKMNVTYDDGKVGFDDFVRVIEKAGFAIEQDKSHAAENESKPYSLTPRFCGHSCRMGAVDLLAIFVLPLRIN